jgi:hypothetical protein
VGSVGLERIDGFMYSLRFDYDLVVGCFLWVEACVQYSHEMLDGRRRLELRCSISSVLYLVVVCLYLEDLSEFIE